MSITEENLEHYRVAEDCKDELESLSQGELHAVISRLYQNIHGDAAPEVMRSWDIEELMDWFENAYHFDSVAKVWDVVGITLH